MVVKHALSARVTTEYKAFFSLLSKVNVCLSRRRLWAPQLGDIISEVEFLFLYNYLFTRYFFYFHTNIVINI